MHVLQKAIARHPGAAIAALLCLLVLVVYGQARRFDFVSFDDNLYVYDNFHVKSGIGEDSLAWSFRFDEKNNTYWHPLTWLSHMLDVELFGLDPGAHHLTNVLLHLANCLLLFSVLAAATDSRWLAAAVAALFAVHPVNAESVAWVAERKNVLSTMFWLLTTRLYIVYCRRPNLRRYALMLFVFLLGLLAKPMLVTLPCTFFLLDFWPLRRIGFLRGTPEGDAGMAQDGAGTFPLRSTRELIFEKIPFFVLSALATYLAMGSLRHSDNTISYDMVTLGERLANAIVSYCIYAAKTVWPSGLSMFHPYKLSLPGWMVGLSLLFLVSGSAAAFWGAKKKPYLLFGWLWFVGTLVPVSGIAQVGLWPAWAERWAYVPYIGLFVIVCWGGYGLIRSHGRRLKASAAALAAVLFGCLTVAGYRQAAVWENDVSLYTSAVRADEDNFVALNNLGAVLLAKGRPEEALPHLHEALRINPRFPFPHLSLGLYYSRLEQWDDAERHLEQCVSLEPKSASGHFALAEVVQKKGNFEKAFLHYREALKYNPYEKRTYNNLGVLCLQIGQMEGAIQAFRSAIKLDPDFAEAHNNLGFVYLRRGQIELATQHLEKALALDPGNALALENMKEARQGRENG